MSEIRSLGVKFEVRTQNMFAVTVGTYVLCFVAPLLKPETVQKALNWLVSRVYMQVRSNGGRWCAVDKFRMRVTLDVDQEGKQVFTLHADETTAITGAATSVDLGEGMTATGDPALIGALQNDGTLPRD